MAYEPAAHPPAKRPQLCARAGAAGGEGLISGPCAIARSANSPLLSVVSAKRAFLARALPKGLRCVLTMNPSPASDIRTEKLMDHCL